MRVNKYRGVALIQQLARFGERGAEEGWAGLQQTAREHQVHGLLVAV